MKGAKPVPIPLRMLRADAKKVERLRKRQIEAPGDLSEAPEWFTEDQRTMWQYAVANAPRGVLRGADKAVLAAFIVAQDIHEKASIAMQQSALLVKSPKQELPMQNPYLPIINRQYQLMVRGAAELGFTPCSRARIENGTEQPAVHDPWEDVG
jgi:P27 family predicted phage terminase small subunit